MTDEEYDEFRQTRKFKVARQLVEVGRSLWAFNYGDGQYLSRTVDRAMKEAEKAFGDADYDHAEHLGKVVACLVRREAPKFAANPTAWIERRRELREH